MTVSKYPLVCFDLDGTLVDDTIYIWKTLHEGFATNPVKRQKAFKDYFAKRITYSQWFENDLELLFAAGATRAGIENLLSQMKPMPGAEDLLSKLRDLGHKIAIISGSLDIVVAYMFPKFDFDHILINKLFFDSNGNIKGGEPTPYDLEGKAEGLKELCRREGITTEQAAFIGDNINDLWIAKEAGLSIAFNCKSDELSNVCDVVVEKENLFSIAELLV